MAHVLKCKGASVYSLAVTDKYIICGTYENTVQVGYHSVLLQWALTAGSYSGCKVQFLLLQVWDARTLQDRGILTGL